jgi:hypothetical protein
LVVCSKLVAAQRLLEALLPQDQGLPSSLSGLVQAHYLRSLLDWALGAVTKAPPAAAKRAQQPVPEHVSAPRLHPGLWALLVALLESDAVAASYMLPASLLPAATDALQSCAAATASDAADEQLLRPVAALLHALAHKFAGSFKPGLDPVVAAAEAALAGAAAAPASEPWAAAVVAASALLQHCTQHPNQRKVWDAVVPRLVQPLLEASFGEEVAGARGPLVASCRRVLAAVLFNQAHVTGEISHPSNSACLIADISWHFQLVTAP